MNFLEFCLLKIEFFKFVLTLKNKFFEKFQDNENIKNLNFYKSVCFILLYGSNGIGNFKNIKYYSL